MVCCSQECTEQEGEREREICNKKARIYASQRDLKGICLAKKSTMF